LQLDELARQSSWLWLTNFEGGIVVVDDTSICYKRDLALHSYLGAPEEDFFVSGHSFQPVLRLKSTHN
jgi:hypothetical protein